MAYEENLQLMTLEAGADLSSYKYCIVQKSTTDRQVTLADTDDDPAIGVLMDSDGDAAGVPVAVAIGGVCPVKRGAGTITAGIEVCAGTGGKAVPLAASDGDEVNVLGLVIATHGASNDGEIISVLIRPYKFMTGAAIS